MQISLMDGKQIPYKQKQPPKGVPRKRCSENMHIIEITLRLGCFPVNLLHIFKTPFSKNTYGWLLLYKQSWKTWFEVWIKLKNVPFMDVVYYQPYSGWAFSGLLTDEGAKRSPLPKICYIYPTMMKLGTVITYLKRIQKLYESRDTPLDFCWHQHFFFGNKQILLYHEIQI